MKFCEECGKKLGIFSGYNHPILGKKSYVCGDCFHSEADSLSGPSGLCHGDGDFRPVDVIRSWEFYVPEGDPAETQGNPGGSPFCGRFSRLGVPLGHPFCGQSFP